MPPSEFWDATPREYAAVIRGIVRRFRREHNWSVTSGFYQVYVDRDPKPKGLDRYIIDLDEDGSGKKSSDKELPASEGLISLFNLLSPLARGEK